MNELPTQESESQSILPSTINFADILTEEIKNARLLHSTELKGRQKLWPDSYFTWVQDNWTSRGEPLDFEKHKYLVQIYEDQSPDITYMKGAQVGLTERMITEALWLPDQHNENSIYIFPTSGTVGDLVQERVNQPLGGRKYLREIVDSVKANYGKHADKVSLKRMTKGFVYFRGSNSPTQITSVPADAMFADEVDRMIQENTAYFDKRLGHSKRKWQRWASTPTLPNYGIHKRFITTDQMHYYIKCKECGQWQTLDFFENVIYKMKNDTQCEWARLVCHSCKHDIVPWECEDEWRAHNPESSRRGYFINKLYSPYVDIREMVEASMKSAEWEKMQFYNQELGLPYAPEGGSIDLNILNACVRDYEEGDRTGVNYMGVDVGLYLHVIIQNDRNQIVSIQKVKSFDDLDKLMNEYNIKTCVVDALPETRKVQEFAQRFRGRVYMCYYSKLTEPKPDEWFQVHHEDSKVNTRRTLSLDNWTDRMRRQDVQLPKNLLDHTEFIEHMAMMTRVIEENRGGDLIAKYVKTGPDHYFHAGNYSNIAKAVSENIVEPDFAFV